MCSISQRTAVRIQDIYGPRLLQILTRKPKTCVLLITWHFCDNKQNEPRSKCCISPACHEQYKSYALQNECDQSDGLHSHIILLIQCHWYYTVLLKQMRERTGINKQILFSDQTFFYFKWVMILFFVLAGVTLKRLVKSSSLGNNSRFVYRFCRAFRHFRRTSPCWKKEERQFKLSKHHTEK